LSTLLLHLALQRPSWRRWIAYAAVVTLVGWAHMLALTVLVGHAYAVFTRWRAERDPILVRWLVVTSLAVVPVLPLVWLGLSQHDRELDWIGPMTPSRVWSAPGEIFGSAAAGLLVIGLAFATRGDRRVVRELAVLAAAPPVLLIGASFAGASLWVPRYVLFIVPAVALLAASALRGLRLPALGALLLLAAVAVPAQRAVRGPVSHMGSDFRTVAQVIAAWQRPGDVIVYGGGGNWSLRSGIDYQLRGRPQPRDVLLKTPAAEVAELTAVQCPDQVACLHGAKRVWFFRAGADGAPWFNSGPLGPVFRRDYRQVQIWHPTQATLVLYEHH
jgi:mannosyltransferase